MVCMALCFTTFSAKLLFFFLDNRQYIFQRQLETNTAGASSLQAKAIEAGRLLGPEEKEKLESSVYFAASWAAAFPLLLTQKKKQTRDKGVCPQPNVRHHRGDSPLGATRVVKDRINTEFGVAFHNDLPPVLSLGFPQFSPSSSLLFVYCFSFLY